MQKRARPRRIPQHFNAGSRLRLRRPKSASPPLCGFPPMAARGRHTPLRRPLKRMFRGESTVCPFHAVPAMRPGNIASSFPFQQAPGPVGTDSGRMAHPGPFNPT